MHIRRIGMFQSLLPLILSSLLIATTAIPRIPHDPLAEILNPTTPTVTNPQDGPSEIKLMFPNLVTNPVPPDIIATNSDPAVPQQPQDPQPQDPQPQDPQPQDPQPQDPQPQDPQPQDPQPQPQDPALEEPPTINLAENSLAKEFLDLHNFARRHAKLPPFVWDPKLEQYAKEYALKRKNSGDCQTLVHSMGPYGENLFWGRGSTWKPKDAVRKWVKEHRFYDPEANVCRAGKMCGHYTQVVWRDTTSVGCAVETCPNNDTLTVCSYDPPGNYLGEKPSIHYVH